MNRIPKSAYDALASQRSAEEHPSADLLNGYIEQSLSAAEKDGVALHLAACEDCREVVFLASAAAEKQPAATIADPARGWHGWRWAVPAVAVLALASSILIGRRQAVAPLRSAATQTTADKASALSSQAVASQATPESKSLALASSPAVDAKLKPPERARATVTKSTETSARDQAAAGTSTEGSRKEREALALLTKPATPPSPRSVAHHAGAPSAASAAAASPNELQTAFAQQPPSSQAFHALGGSSFQSMNNAAAPPGLSGASRHSVTVRSRWRITDEGHLERSQIADTWTRVLSDQPVWFRVVALVGTDVWAGGNNGVLFHSVDGGEHWTQVVLSADGHSETGAVVSIHFDTVSQGSVSTETGSTWTTLNRGQSWNK